MALLIHKFVIGNVPVATRRFQGSFKDHVTISSPHLQQKGETVIVFLDSLVDYFEKHGAEEGVLIVVAAGNNFVELLERYGVHDVAHELLS